MKNEKVTDSLARLHKELERLEPAVEHIAAARQVTEETKKIPKQNQAFLDGLREEIDTMVKEAVAMNKGLHASAETFLSGVTEESTKLHNAITTESETIGGLTGRVKNYYDRIELIDFPQRLDKVDMSVSSTMNALQNLQTKIDFLERNYVEKMQAQKEFLEGELRSQRNLSYAILVVVVLSVIISLALK